MKSSSIKVMCYFLIPCNSFINVKAHIFKTAIILFDLLILGNVAVLLCLKKVCSKYQPFCSNL